MAIDWSANIVMVADKILVVAVPTDYRLVPGRNHLQIQAMDVSVPDSGNFSLEKELVADVYVCRFGSYWHVEHDNSSSGV